MNLDNFPKRRRPSLDDGAPEYDFTQIAQNAVSDMRAAQDAGDFWSDDAPSSFDPASLDGLYSDAAAPEAPERRRKGFSFGGGKKKEQSADPWDQPRDRSSVTGEPDEPRRKGFGFGKNKQAAAPADEFDRPLDRSEVEEAQTRKGFSFGRNKQAAAPADEFDRPLDRSEVEEAQTRKSFGFGRNKQAAAPADEFDRPLDRSEVEESQARRGFGFGRNKQAAAPASANPPASPAAEPETRRGAFRPKAAAAETPSASAGTQSPVEVMSPASSAVPPSAPAPGNTTEQPERRVFNAATQPNYSYMTDYPEEDAPRSSSASSGNTGMIGVIKSNLRSRFGKDEPGVNYYTPPAGHVPSPVRRRQKRRNRKPLRAWTKALFFAIGMIAAFSLILYIAFYTIITGRINYVGNSTKNPVYLSVEEYANLNADLTDTEENAAEFTEPMTITESGNDVRVIMVVSSDNRIGDTYDASGRKRTNNSAKTDSIMLVAIDHANRRIRVASIMTDTYVRIQDYRTNKLSKAYYYDTANGDYTLSCLRQAVRDNFGVVPDNYVVVDFNAFQILVNRLGGIDINVSADEAYYMSAHERYGDFPRFNSAGSYKMSGPEALNYVRMRAVGNDDYDRCARQRTVFRQMLTQLSDMSKLELAELAYALLPELPTDMSAGQLFDYFSDASDIASYEINEVTFPITNSWRYGTASVRDESEEPEDTAPPAVSDSDVVSDSDLSPSTPPVDPRSTKFTVIVTNFQFNANALQKFLYDNDDSYLNGTAANGISVPEIIAPLDADSPAVGLQPAV